MDVSGELKGDANTVSTAGDNRFSASATTLTAGDRLDGGDGADTLQVTTTAAATLGAGVVTAGIETVSATATVGALDLNVGTFAGITTLTSSGSTAGVTFSNVQVIPTVNVTATSSDVTVSMAAAVTAGITDSITINLNTAASNGNNTVTVNGIEKVNVVATGNSGNTNADGSIYNTTVVSDAVRELTISGTGSSKLAVNMTGAQTGTTGAAATVTGSAGADDLTLSTPAAASKVSASLGAGDDVLRLSGVNAAQTISGGDGTDTLVYTGTTAVAATATAGLTSFEKVVLSGPASFALATSDLTYTVAASGTYTGLAAGGSVALQAGGTLTLANTALTGAADAVTVTVGRSTSTAPVNATIAAGEFDVVTVNALARADVLSTTSATYTVTGTTLNKVTLVSSQGAVLAGGGVALATIDASAVKGAFSNTATTSATASLSITGGDGNDNITGGAKGDVLVGGAGNDTLTGGVGADTLTGGAGNDTFVIGANGGTADTTFSSSTVTDVITDFESGKDRLQLSQAVNAFVGNVANIQLGLAAMTGANQAFFVTSENTLYVVSGFANNAGVLANTDTIVKLTGVTSLTAADLSVGSSTGGADLTLTAAGATATLTVTDKVRVTTDYTANATLNTTGVSDTVRATGTQLANATASTLSGGNGTDTLVITGGGTLTTTNLASVTGFEQITLGETTVVGGTTDAFNISVDDVNIPASEAVLTISAASVSTVNVTINGANVDNTTAANGPVGGRLNIVGGSYALGAAGDTLTGGNFNDTINGGAGNDLITGGLGNDSLTGGTGDDVFVVRGTDTVDGGAGNDLVEVGFSIGSSATDLASIELGAGVNRINFNDNASIAFSSVAATGGNYEISVASGKTGTLTPAQFAGAFRVLGDGTTGETVAANAEGITFSTNGTIDVSASTVEKITLSAGSGATAGANVLTVSANQTTIVGANGNDTIRVSSDAAAATVLGTATNTVSGGTGNDTIEVTGNTATGAITLSAGVTGIETITFANSTTDVSLTTVEANVAAGETLVVSATSLGSSNKLTFNGSAELGGGVAADAGKFSVTGGAGADTITGGVGADTLTGGSGADSILGGAGTDSITGGAGDDVLKGEAGADFISGGTGNDTITAGGGADTVTGGAGVDRFAFDVADSTLANLVTITDYRSATGDNAGALDLILDIANVTEAAGSVATVQDFSSQTSLGAALNAAAASNDVVNGLVAFMYGGNTYFLVESDSAGSNVQSFVGTDFLVMISGTPFTTSTALTSLGFGTIA